MTLAPTYKAIKHETSGKPSIRENLLSYWALDISVRMVYHHQLSVNFVRVWRCFTRIVRSYLRYCILPLSILFCYGICESLIYIMSVCFVSDGKLHSLICVETHSLNWIHFPLLTLVDSFVWIGIVHGILVDISVWYHRIWWILYTCKVIKGYACTYLGLLGVACSPILSVSLEEVSCEPVLNLATTPDEAVSKICTICWQNYTFNFLGEVDVCELYYWPARVFSRASRRCSSINLSVGSLTWLTYALWDALSRWHCSWRVLTLQCACRFFGLGTSTHVRGGTDKKFEKKNLKKKFEARIS